MDLYLIDYSSHFEEPIFGYEPEVDRLIDLSPSLEKIAKNNRWITEGETIYVDLRNTIPKHKNSIQIRFVKDWDGSRKPVLIYDDKKISPEQTKESSIGPTSIYQFLTKDSDDYQSRSNYMEIHISMKKRLEEHFDVSRLMAVASSSNTDFFSKGKRIINSIRSPNSFELLEPETEETYKLTPIANLLRMGLDYGYYKHIIRTHPVSSMIPTLKNHFSETIHNQKKNMDEIDVTKKGKYDFFGHTVYIDTLSPEYLHNFHKLVKPNTPNIPDYDSTLLREDIINSYEKIKDFELFDLLTEKENPSTIYAFLLPVIEPKEEAIEDPGYVYGNINDRNHIAFAKNPKSMFHEITESITQDLYSIRMGTIFANAVSNVIDDSGECGTMHTFSDNGDFDLDNRVIDDKANFNRAKKITRYLPHDQLEDFVKSLLEATENTGHTNFNDANPYEILFSC